MNTLRHSLFLLLLSAAPVGAQPMIWDTAAIDSLRRHTDSRLYKDIILQADAICKAAPVAVTEKKETRSGDSHNYESPAIYLWRDTANPQGPYITKDGQINPEHKAYDLPRLASLTARARYLSVAYRLTRRERYFRAFCRQLDAWFIDRATRMNANFEYSQFIPSAAGGKGTAAGIIDAYDFNDVIEAIRLTDTVKGIGRRRTKKIKKWFLGFARWMQQSDIGKDEAKKTNNHGTAYDITLYNMSLFAGDTITCTQIFNRFTALRIDTQIESDGKQPQELLRTRAFHYSVYNLTHIIDFAILLANEGKAFTGKTKTDAALAYLARFIGRQEAFPYKEMGDWKDAENRLTNEIRRYARADSLQTNEKETNRTITDINTLLR